jgi:hypothetical protein
MVQDAEQVIKIKPSQFNGDPFIRFVKPGIEERNDEPQIPCV